MSLAFWKKNVFAASLGVALAFAWQPAQADLILSATGSGTVHSEFSSGEVGGWIQVGQVASIGNTRTSAIGGATSDTFDFGTFSSYSANPLLPQVGGDLAQYGWAIDGVVDSIIDHTITYSGTMWILAPGYGFNDTTNEYLEKATFSLTADFVSDWSTATITGSVIAEAGMRQPTGWPEAVDWFPAGPMTFSGTFDSSTNTITGTLEAVPEPSSLVLMGLMGTGVVVIQTMRRRKKSSAA